VGATPRRHFGGFLQITTYVRALLAGIGIAAMAHAQSATKAITDSGCQILVPADWTETTLGGKGARSPEDRAFNAIVRGFKSDEYQAAVDSMKGTKGAVVDENGKRILLLVPFYNGKKQYVAITKTSPLACRASARFAEGQEAVARKIVESVKPIK
jgi:hypothetical protein